MSKMDVYEAFEAYVMSVLQQCVNFLGEQHSCQKVLVYTGFGAEGVRTFVDFVAQGHLVSPADADGLRAARDYTPQELMAQVNGDAQHSLLTAVREAEKVPHHIVISYDPSTGRMESDWDYDTTPAPGGLEEDHRLWAITQN